MTPGRNLKAIYIVKLNRLVGGHQSQPHAINDYSRALCDYSWSIDDYSRTFYDYSWSIDDYSRAINERLLLTSCFSL